MLNENVFYLSEIDEKWRRKYSFHENKEVTLKKVNINSIQRIPGLDAKMVEENKIDTSKFYKLTVEGRRLSIEDLTKCKLD